MKNEILSTVVKWMELGEIVLSKISQPLKNEWMLYVLYQTWALKNEQLLDSKETKTFF